MLRGRISLALSLSCAFAAPAVKAATILPGLYQLNNHPDGAEAPPLYGLRLDELYNATGGHDEFTFDFDDPQSDMELFYNDVNDTMTISGVAFGGRDVGGSYANDQYLGLYTLSFVYDINLGDVPGDDDVFVSAPPDLQNNGTISTPLSREVKTLRDVGMGGYTFRFGDEDDDNGHRGFDGISGWGWLDVDGEHTEFQDWIFTATYIPEPGTLALMSMGLFAIVRRSRRA